MASVHRLNVLQQHLAPDASSSQSVLDAQPCASSSRSHALPRVDVQFLEAYLDVYKDLKKDVYSKLEGRSDLLVPLCGEPQQR